MSDDNSVPYLLDPLKAALDAVHAVGWALRAGIDVELPAGGGYGAHPIEALDYRPSFWRMCRYHLRVPSGGPASDLVGVRPVTEAGRPKVTGGQLKRSRHRRCCLVALGEGEGSEAAYDERSGPRQRRKPSPTPDSCGRR